MDQLFRGIPWVHLTMTENKLLVLEWNEDANSWKQNEEQLLETRRDK